MMWKKKPTDEETFFNIDHARWVVGVLGMLIAIVGKNSLLGLLLRQTRREIDSVIQDEEPIPAVQRAARYRNN